MAFGAEQSCVVNPNVVIPRVVRRRPKLVPPKLKRFTRARINLNHVWPLVDGESDLCQSETSPLQSSSRFNSVSQLPYSTQRPARGNDLFSRAHENSENLSTFVRIPSMKRGHSTSSFFKREDLLNEKLHLISCSAPVSQEFRPQKVVCDDFELGNKNFEPPLVSLDDLAAVLGDYEKEGALALDAPPEVQDFGVRHSAHHVELPPRARLLRDSPSFHHFFGHHVSSLDNDLENFAAS